MQTERFALLFLLWPIPTANTKWIFVYWITEINKEENRVNTFTHRNLDVQRPTADDEESDWDEELEDFDDEDIEWDEDWNDDDDNAGGHMVDDIEYV